MLKIDSGTCTWWRIPQQLRFLLAGSFNTAFGYAVFTSLYLLLGHRIHYLIVGILAYSISVVSAFAVYRSLVFRSSRSLFRSFVRFNLSQFAALGLGMVGLYSLVEFGHLNPLLAQAIVVVISAFFIYVLHRYFSFGVGSSDGLVGPP
jgi:putative flippase GtrA